MAFREGEKKIYRADLEDVTTDKQQGFEYKEVIISSDPTSASNHVAKLTSTEPLGMLRNLEVSKGDVVKVKVKGYYAGGSVTHSNAVNWGLTLGQVNGHSNSGEISTENTPFLLNLGLSITPNNGGNNPNATVPSGYLKLVFYKKDGTPVTASLQIAHLSPGAGQWQDLELTYTATERGYLQAFVANESDQEVFFDDMVVEHTPQLIVQENHYYPFGMNLRGIEKRGTPEHRYQYNAGTELEKSFDLNLYETPFRGYDAQLGRFHGIDDLALMMPSITPYQYAFNDPVLFNDPTGLAPEGSDAIEDRRLDDWTQENEEYGRHQNTLLDAQHGRWNSSGGVGNNKDHGHSCPTHGAGCSGYHSKKSSRLKAAAVMTLASPTGKVLFEGMKVPHPIVKAAAFVAVLGVATYYYMTSDDDVGTHDPAIPVSIPLEGTKEDDPTNYVTIYKAPAPGKAQTLLVHGFQEKDFPRDAYSDGAAYFAPPGHRAVAQHWAKIYNEGILEIRMPKKIYESIFKVTNYAHRGKSLQEGRYPGPAPDMGVNPREVAIPRELFHILNTFPRTLKPN
ncbi:RHS repeat domain-containing protein [Microscilla marina]|uniref:RHS repeat domain-containing protein n=1 Tax=Microscilla marina TaxID=1027 RepID=UPI000314DFAC|nr:RHS repeat-associated core domain-containing protein [Microscilla marina]